MSSEQKSGQTVGEVYGKIVDREQKITAEEVDTIWKAAAYGDTDKLKQFLEEDGSRGNQPDSNGYRPLQWAALNNRVAAMTLLFEYQADVNATEPGGQTALHWATTRGHLPAVELLLRTGAVAAQADARGYTICHVAAQYGQTTLLHHLALKWHVNTDATDTDGRSPLHWAAYKGNGDCIRLLLCLGSDMLLADREGCTPLHWAAIKGNHEACTLLIMGGAAEALSMSDSTGSTPSQLASQKGHYMCSEWLARERANKEDKDNKGGIGGLCPGGVPRGMKHLAPLLWGVILGLLGMFLHYVVSAPLWGVSAGTPLSAWLVSLCALGGLVFLLRAGVKDPGFVCCGGPAKSECDVDAKRSSTMTGLDSPMLWEGHWHMLCLQCRKVRPPRSKYCRVSQRCVSRFDHYCPWIGNAVGEKNHFDFVVFLMLETCAMLIALVVSIHYLRSLQTPLKQLADSHTGALAFVFCDGLVLLSVTMLTCAQLGQVFQNMTTNEFANQHRYKYLQGADGSFKNPYDKGCLPNTVDFFCGPEMVDKLAILTDPPPVQMLDDHGNVHSHQQSLFNRNASPSGRALGMIAACCQKLCSMCPTSHHGHGHSHGHGKACCKKERTDSVKDIEDAL